MLLGKTHSGATLFTTYPTQTARNLTRVSCVSGELTVPPCSVKNVSHLGSGWSISYSLYIFLRVFCLSFGRSAVSHRCTGNHHIVTCLTNGADC